MNYETPGVYVEEKSIFPPSVAQVETAIPAFIGYTHEGPINEPTKISSMLEYEQSFGGPKPQPFEVTLDDEKPYLPQEVTFDGDRTPYLMHPALQMFYANGGGPCYIVSVGSYNSSGIEIEKLNDGLKKNRKVDEVTLIVFPEASQLDNSQEQYDLYNAALSQCGELKDRFGIFDLRSNDKDASKFRSGIGTSYLSYGAAYYPHLNTSIPIQYTESKITFSHSPSSTAFNGLQLDEVRMVHTIFMHKKRVSEVKTIIEEAEAQSASTSINNTERARLLKSSASLMQRVIRLGKEAIALVGDESVNTDSFDDAKEAFDDFKPSSFTSKPDMTGALGTLEGWANDAKEVISKVLNELNTNQTDVTADSNEVIGDYFTSKFESQLQELLNEQLMTLPPSSAIAGIYAKVDGDRGVWKSPANISINRVSGPAKKLTLEDNDTLNVDSTGKSVNAIRAFTGKGTLVWGARTLDGNSNEWCYISVRRFFNMVEESVKKSTEPFVFEPNDANTWVKVKAMIENYLTLQWRAGALMGAKPKQAFFVKVGLGETMTQQDVLNGKMIVEIGMAVVRPAEFIILRFSHNMLES